MLSGVGPSEHLKEHGIPVVHDLPGVGSHLVDHPVVDFCFKDKLGLSTKFLAPKTALDVARLTATIFQYRMFKRGPLATNVSIRQNQTDILISSTLFPVWGICCIL